MLKYGKLRDSLEASGVNSKLEGGQRWRGHKQVVGLYGQVQQPAIRPSVQLKSLVL